MSDNMSDVIRGRLAELYGADDSEPEPNEVDEPRAPMPDPSQGATEEDGGESVDQRIRRALYGG